MLAAGWSAVQNHEKVPPADMPVLQVAISYVQLVPCHEHEFGPLLQSACE